MEVFWKRVRRRQAKFKIPEAHTDYIVSVISEEFGIILVILIMFVYLFLAFTIAKKIDEENDNLVKLILTGSISILLIQNLHSFWCKHKNFTDYRNDSTIYKLWWFINCRYSYFIRYNTKFN